MRGFCARVALSPVAATALLFSSFSPVTAQDGEIKNACVGRIVGPEVGISAVARDRSEVDKLRPSDQQCIRSPSGYAIDVSSIDQNIWSPKNDSVSHAEYGANDGGVGRVLAALVFCSIQSVQKSFATGHS